MAAEITALEGKLSTAGGQDGYDEIGVNDVKLLRLLVITIYER